MNDRSTIIENKKKIMKIFSATEDSWNDWRWQLSHSAFSVTDFSKIFNISVSECEEIEKISKIYRWKITPHYLSQIRKVAFTDPFYLQSVPFILELSGQGVEDPMAEEYTNPAGAITRRYPDRVIINVTNCCPMFCRHCQRRRNIGMVDKCSSSESINESLDYIKLHPEIRDVLITGGDPFTLSDAEIENIIQRIRQIPTVEIIRIGTRTPVTLPQRITVELAGILKKYAPIYINTQFNHPLEMTPESKKACEILSENGIVLGNQMVFLKEVNNDAYIVRLLNQLLLQNRVRPYYIFHPKIIVGTQHFSISIKEGISIVDSLRGHTSGLAIPAYVINVADGLGKITLSQYDLLKKDKQHIYLTTWEGKEFIADNS